jgi:DNA-binding response OmpR family regulator
MVPKEQRMDRAVRVLIVEDEWIAANYLEVILKKEGFEIVDMVDTGVSAVEVALQERPDVILMDIMLRDAMSGSEAALIIHRDAPEIITIFLSAYSDKEMLQYAMDAQSYGYLMKPYREEEIINTIQLAVLKHADRVEQTSDNDLLHLCDGVVYDRRVKRLMRGKVEIPLKEKSLVLIDHMAHFPNQSVSSEQLAHLIWGEERNEATLRTLVHRTRALLPDGVIVSVSGVGYLLKTEVE